MSLWCSELSCGIYCRVKWLSTDVSEVRTASIIRDHPWKSFYTTVYPRRQLWTSYSPPWELEISHTYVPTQYTNFIVDNLQISAFKHYDVYVTSGMFAVLTSLIVFVLHVVTTFAVNGRCSAKVPRGCKINNFFLYFPFPFVPLQRRRCLVAPLFLWIVLVPCAGD
jgi:hypothetical protein